MATNRLTSIEKSKLNKFRIDCLELDCEGTIRCNDFTSLSGANTTDFGGAELLNIADPTQNTSAATKQYVDGAVAGGGGAGSVSNPMVVPLQANNFDIYNVDEMSVNTIYKNGTGDVSINSNLSLNSVSSLKNVIEIQVEDINGVGGIAPRLVANLNMNDNQIKNLLAPTISTDATNKAYVDFINTNLQGQITNADNNIAANVTSITNNANSISTNTADITTNTGNITTNTGNLSTLQSDLATTNTTVSGISSQQTTNTNNISSNTSAIALKTSIDDNTANSTTTTFSSQKITTLLETAGDKSFVGLSGSTAKVNLNTVSTQPIYGRLESYTAYDTIQSGQPVRFFYDAGVVKVSSIGALPTDLHQIAGINLTLVTAGNTANIMSNGFCTARCTSITVAQAETVELNSTTNGTTRGLTNNTTFTDSGGTGGSYGANENYSITFDAGSGNSINMAINSLAFEHTNLRYYDRLGMQESSDGVNFTNVSYTGFHKSNNQTPPYGSYTFNSAGATNDTPGQIFPNGTSMITAAGGSLSITTGSRFLQFIFRSDSSSQQAGWNISLTPATAYSGTELVAEGSTLYLNNSDYSRIATDNASGLAIGYCAYNNAENDSLFVRTHVASHS